jgi:tetratricopeptide (TPR) repeat protein
VKQLLLFILVLWFNPAAFAQDRMDDSLKVHRQKFALSKKDNLAKVRLFNALASDYRRNNYDSAIFYGRKALKLAKQIGSVQQEGFAEWNLEFSLRETGNLAEALNLELDLLDKARSREGEGSEFIVYLPI